jgi:hypothetical protein
MLAQPAPQRAAAPTRIFFFHGPEESKYSSSPLGNPLPTIGSFCCFLFGYREFGLRGLPGSASTTTSNSKARIPMVNSQPFRISGYRDSGVRGSREHNSHTMQNPDPRTPMCFHLSSTNDHGPTRHVTSRARAIGDREIAVLDAQGYRPCKPRIPTSQDLWPRALSDQWLHSNQFGKSPVAISKSIKLLASKGTPNAELRSKGILRHVSSSRSTVQIHSGNRDSRFYEG